MIFAYTYTIRAVFLNLLLGQVVKYREFVKEWRFSRLTLCFTRERSLDSLIGDPERGKTRVLNKVNDERDLSFQARFMSSFEWLRWFHFEYLWLLGAARLNKNQSAPFDRNSFRLIVSRVLSVIRQFHYENVRQLTVARVRLIAQ